MGKDKNIRLVNIYLKIHNKRSLTMDDLSYLAKYDQECFEKTCKNVVYNIPEAKPIMETSAPKITSDYQKPELPKQPSIDIILDNIKRMELDEFPITDIDVNTVKDLLGSLYMELLFPHNDKYNFFSMTVEDNTSSFDKKV